jgi:signal transduction histidine kinase/CheY-like chemotaxis protein
MQSPAADPSAHRGGVSLTAQELQAQAALLPYALVFFAVTLPMFVWAGSYALNAAWMSALLAQFAINWAAFYLAVGWLRRQKAEDVGDRKRLLIQLAGGLLWAVTVAEISLFGVYAGPVSDIILMMGAAVAAACLFFSSPCLPSLLIVGPAAAAAPTIALWATAHDRNVFPLTLGGLAMAMALCLILNRILRRQFTLATERETLIAARAESLAKAEILAKSKSDILATLSHEIRNGLTGVTHVLAAAAGASGRPPSRDQLAAALDSTHQLLEVLNATLDTETAGQGRLSVAAKPFDPRRMARDLVLLNRPNASAKAIEISVHVDSSLDEAMSGAAVADAIRSRQILSNLIGNAVKYTQRGRIEVRVQRADERTVRVEIADTGPGLSPEELERAFQPFSRIDRTGLGLPGAGLGLSLSRELARLMGGEVSAQSAVGVGSRFWLDLPYDPLASAPAERVEASVEARAAAPPPAQNLRILVAEDDQLNAAMLRAILEQLGHQVVHARDGRRAVELAEVCAFDLIMLDGRMPYMTGAEAAEAIRALDGEAGRTPIVAVIGGGAEEAEECTSAGVDEVLRKPVSVAAVARSVASAVARSKREQAEAGHKLQLVS